jgi:hypothetical protein
MRSILSEHNFQSLDDITHELLIENGWRWDTIDRAYYKNVYNLIISGHTNVFNTCPDIINFVIRPNFSQYSMYERVTDERGAMVERQCGTQYIFEVQAIVNGMYHTDLGTQYIVRTLGDIDALIAEHMGVYLTAFNIPRDEINKDLL